jgi:hypothetical protein
MPEHDGTTPPPGTPPAPPPPDDPQRRLADAAARSPELAAMLAGGSGRRPRRSGGRRAALLAAGVALGAILAVTLAVASRRTQPGSPSGEDAGRPPGSGESPGTLIAPLERAPDPTTGEVVSAFSGFAVSVETDPPGAVVTIDGAVRGESPVFAGLDCRAGDEVRIRAEKAGSGAAEATTTCRADTLVRRSLRLRR